MKATQIGKFKYTIKIPKIINEDNKINNERDFSIEVIDESKKKMRAINSAWSQIQKLKA